MRVTCSLTNQFVLLVSSRNSHTRMTSDPMYDCDLSASSRLPSSSNTALEAPHEDTYLDKLILFLEEWRRMATVPQGMFAAQKMRAHLERVNEDRSSDSNSNSAGYSFKDFKLLEHLPLQYNSKLMNSIWGQYNRYSVHNVKQHTDKKGAVFGDGQQPVFFMATM